MTSGENCDDKAGLWLPPLIVRWCTTAPAALPASRSLPSLNNAYLAEKKCQLKRGIVHSPGLYHIQFTVGSAGPLDLTACEKSWAFT
jgi:hypothetical protein